MIAPLSGEILEVNERAVSEPELVNDDPYGDGWLDPHQAVRPVGGRLAARRRRVPRAPRNRMRSAEFRPGCGMSTAGYLSLTDEDRDAMLEAIGVGSIDELFAQIPDAVRFSRELDVPAALGESELVRHLEQLAARNAGTSDELSFLGCGIYDHYVPAIVDTFLGRGELLTAYTPYQPEMSQGVLQAIFEYQTAICELTGMDVSNASGYDGMTVAADACFVAKAHTGRSADRACRDAAPDGAPGREDLRARLRDGGRRGRARRRHDRPDPVRRGRRRRRRRDLPAAERVRLPRGSPCARRGGERRRRALGRPRRPRLARRARGAWGLRVLDGDRRGTVDRQLPELRWSALRVPRCAEPSSSGGCPAASSARPPT